MRTILSALSIAAATAALLSCSMKQEMPDIPGQNKDKRKVSFNVEVTRDGEIIPDEAITKGGSGRIATMAKGIPFGLVGIDMVSGTLLMDNEAVTSSGGEYQGFFDGGLWDLPVAVTLSAYYPYVGNIAYGNDFESYSIPFSAAETEAGPLISKTMECAMDRLGMVPLEFQHITDDIGYKICDVTVDPNLQGLIHLRKVTATNVASAGIFVNDLVAGDGFWHRRGYYRDVVVFEGNARVGVGMENEKFIASDRLVDHMVDSNRYYAIPDDIEIGKQCVEVIYDVDAFTLNNYTYEPMKNQIANFMLYGVLADNVLAYGKQYTFHLGLDVGKLYKEITFVPSVGDWETKIYENNDTF